MIITQSPPEYGTISEIPDHVQDITYFVPSPRRFHHSVFHADRTPQHPLQDQDAKILRGSDLHFLMTVPLLPKPLKQRAAA